MDIKNIKIYRSALTDQNTADRETEYLFRTEELNSSGEITVSTEYSRTGEIQETVRYSHDDKQRLILEEMRNKETDSNCRITRTFNDAENTYIEQEFFGEEEEISRLIRLDDKGNPVYIATREDGEPHTEEEFEYRGEHPIRHTVNNRLENTTEETQYSYENGNMTEELFLENGEEAGRITFSYGENGKVDKISYTDREEPPMVQKFSYDAAGNVIRIESHSEGVLAGIILQTWDDRGRRLSEEHRDETDSVSHGYKCSYNEIGKIKEEIYFDSHSGENYTLRYEYS